MRKGRGIGQRPALGQRGLVDEHAAQIEENRCELALQDVGV